MVRSKPGVRLFPMIVTRNRNKFPVFNKYIESTNSYRINSLTTASVMNLTFTIQRSVMCSQTIILFFKGLLPIKKSSIDGVMSK
jgi:hypothetical protein